MDIKNEDQNEPTNQLKQSESLSDGALKPKQKEVQTAKRIRKKGTEEQLSNPLHGVKLKDILTQLVAHYGWAYLAKEVNIRCFMYNPNMKSSLGFLRKTKWAREHLEDVYLGMLDNEK
jgi:uncharacterized protein (DUF2132 family)